MSLPRSRGSILALLLVISASCTDHQAQLSGPDAQLRIDASVNVTVAPAEVTLNHIGAVTTLTAALVNPAGKPVNAPVRWTVEPAGVVESLGGGQFRAVGYGTATVYASVGASPVITGSATITVTQGVANVTLTPASSTLDARGATVQIVATVTDGAGAPLPSPFLVWTSSDPNVATVDVDIGHHAQIDGRASAPNRRCRASPRTSIGLVAGCNIAR